LADEKFNRGNIPHQNRLPFSLLLSFGQTKERRSVAQAEKGSKYAKQKKREEYCLNQS